MKNVNKNQTKEYLETTIKKISTMNFILRHENKYGLHTETICKSFDELKSFIGLAKEIVQTNLFFAELDLSPKDYIEVTEYAKELDKIHKTEMF